MKQLVEAIFKGALSNFFNKETHNSHNITENHFHGPVTFIQPIAKKRLRSKSKISSNT